MLKQDRIERGLEGERGGPERLTGIETQDPTPAQPPTTSDPEPEQQQSSNVSTNGEKSTYVKLFPSLAEWGEIHLCF